ncbi:MAG: flippase [Acidobacteriota bacterium]
MIGESELSHQAGLFSQSAAQLIRKAVSSDLVRKVAETFATRLVLIATGVVTSVMVARVLGPEGRGLYAVAMTTSLMGIQFGNLGLPTSNTYYGAKRRELLPALLGNSLFISFCFGTLAVAGVGLVFALRPTIAPLQGTLLILALAWIPIGLAYLLLQNLLLGIQAVRAYNRIELASKLVSVGLIAIIILVGLVTVETVFVASLLALLISFFLALKCLVKRITGGPTLSHDLFFQNMRYGFKAYLTALFAFLMLRADLLMIRYLLDAEQAGYYSVAANLADLVYLLPATVGTIVFPKLAALDSSRDKWRLSRQLTFGVGALMVPITLLAAVSAKMVVSFLFGERFLPAVPAFLLLLPGILFYSAAFCLPFLSSIGLPRGVLWLWAAVVAFNLSINACIIPRFGILGAAGVSSVTYTLCFFVFTFYAWKLARGQEA